jgi:hypothetical protein
MKLVLAIHPTDGKENIFKFTNDSRPSMLEKASGQSSSKVTVN